MSEIELRVYEYLALARTFAQSALRSTSKTAKYLWWGVRARACVCIGVFTYWNSTSFYLRPTFIYKQTHALNPLEMLINQLLNNKAGAVMNVYMHKIIFGNLRGMPNRVFEKTSMGSNGDH